MDVKFFNFVVCVMCLAFAFYHKKEENTVYALTDVVLVLLNLPFAIKWLIEFFN